MFGGRRRGGARSGGFALVLLGSQMMQFGLEHIPPVTLTSIVAQVIIYLKLFIRWPSIREVCISGRHVYYQEDYKRLFLASFFHGGEWHLYYNMVSMLWKGSRLERQFGSVPFLVMTAIFSVLTAVVTVLLSVLADEVTGDYSYLNQCAVGFSGVLFAFKVVSTSQSSGNTLVMGFIPIPNKYACWAELVLIHIMVPNASFLGHLAGILVGLAYVKTPIGDMMNFVMNSMEDIINGPSSSTPSYSFQGNASHNNPQPPPARTGGWMDDIIHGRSSSTPSYSFQGNTSHNNPQPPPATTRRKYRAETYTGGLSEEEQLSRVLEESKTTSQGKAAEQSAPQPSAPPSERGPPPSYQNLYPDLSEMGDNAYNHQQEELRRRRLARLES